MKKLAIILSLSLFIALQLHAQTNTFPSSGNVGIGTTSPSYKLEVTGSSKFSGNLLLGNPNGARTEFDTGSTTNHKMFSSTNKKTIDIDGVWRGGGQIEVLRGDTGLGGVVMQCHPEIKSNNLSIIEMRLDNLNKNAIKLSSSILSTDTYPTNFMQMPSQNSIIVIGGYGDYKKGQGYGLVNRLKTSFENDVYVETGNVGIGTTAPQSKLHIEGINAAGEVGITIKNKDATVGTRSVIDFVTTSTSTIYGSLGVENTSLGAGAMTFSTRGGNFEKMRITSNGNVGIGTTSPDAKLAVKGNIHTQEVKVDLLGAVAPDYVFNNDYKLKSLIEVENYINTKGHLPNIPSAKDMETNGLYLKEMNLKLLEKIEELTLYTIQQEKEITNLKNKTLKVNDLEKELQKQKDRLLKIEELLKI